MSGISRRSSDLVWSTITSDTQMEANHGYIVDSSGPVILTLPTISNVGDKYEVIEINSGTFSVVQNLGQLITNQGVATTPGALNGIVSTATGDLVRLVTTVTDMAFIIDFLQG